MWFKNLVLFKVVGGVEAYSPFEFESRLDGRPLVDPSPIERQSRGWIAANDRLLTYTADHFLFSLGVAERQLPASVVKQELKKRERSLAGEQGYPVGKRQRRELKQKVTDELLAKALIKTRTTTAWLDRQQGLLVVDTSSFARADELVSLLGETHPELKVLPLETAKPVSLALPVWLRAGFPGAFTPEDSLTLLGQNGESVKYQNSDIVTPEINAKLDAMTATQVGVNYKDRLAFVLDHRGIVRKVQLLAMTEDTGGDDEELSQEDRFLADFFLMAGEVSAMLRDLIEALGGSIDK